MDEPTKEEKINFVHYFVRLLLNEGETFFYSGDLMQDYQIIKGTLEHQGYWAGNKYRYYFDQDYNISHVEERKFGE